MILETSWRGRTGDIQRSGRSTVLHSIIKRSLVRTETTVGGDLGRKNQVQVSKELRESQQCSALPPVINLPVRDRGTGFPSRSYSESLTGCETLRQWSRNLLNSLSAKPKNKLEKIFSFFLQSRRNGRRNWSATRQMGQVLGRRGREEGESCEEE